MIENIAAIVLLIGIGFVIAIGLITFCVMLSYEE
jgi:hypothetical protein